MITFTKRTLTRKIGDENLDFHPTNPPTVFPGLSLNNVAVGNPTKMYRRSMLTRLPFGWESCCDSYRGLPQHCQPTKAVSRPSFVVQIGAPSWFWKKKLKMTTFTKRILTRKIGDENLDFHPPIHLQFFQDVPQEVWLWRTQQGYKRGPCWQGVLLDGKAVVILRGCFPNIANPHKSCE